MTTTTYTVQGMTCDHCVASVSAEVSAVRGVSDVEVDLSLGQVRVTSRDPLDIDAVRGAIEEAGYQLVA